MHRGSLIALLFCTAATSAAQQPWSIGARAHYGFLWPHRPSSWILVEEHAPAIELFGEREVSGDQRWHHDYALPSYGVGVLYTGMANPDRIGAAVRVLPYLFLPFTRGESNSFGIRLGWGVGYIAKPYDRIENTKQIAIGSRINTALQLMPEYRLTRGRLRIHAGIGIDHWSNGSVKLPNLGLNYLSANLGASYALAAPAAAITSRMLTDQREPPLREWSVVAAFAMNETVRPLSGQYTVFSLVGQRQWQFTPKSHVMAGLDVFNKGTLATVHPEMKELDRIEYTQFGVHGGYALGFGRGELFLHLGAYAYTPVEDEAPVFHRLGCRYRTGRHLVWSIALKSHYAVASSGVRPGISMELKRVIPFVVLLLFNGCVKEQWDDCITSTGDMRDEERTPGGFHTVELEDRVDLLLEQRGAGSVAIEAGINLIGQVITEVRDSVLYVRNENRCNWVRSFKPRVTVKVPVDGIRRLVLRGTGNVSAADTIRGGHFVLEQWGGQGSASLLLAVDRADLALHTGAGDVSARGHCNDEANLFSGMMGPIDASGLRAPIVNVNNSGVTDIRCWAEEWLDVQIRDVGDVYFRGDPPDMHTDITGSGALIHE